MTRNSTSRTTGKSRTTGATRTTGKSRGRRNPAEPAYSPTRSLKNIGRIIVGDLRRLFGNITAVTMVIGLVAIPSLFAWFNVSANWDPFGNTGNLKFAVANDDEGYRSDLVPVKVNVGENVISALRANDQLDWVFTSREEAIEGTKSGEYYAAVVIPKSFSRDMMTVFSPDVKHASLTYYSNEKKNPLAPK
ncbi:YhgE/Pip family protein [Bifidobacterium callimiconis]|uniref:YhgE/Pip domain-containing protein n=1 Tax=Bifidobacterium callimiconis TaxID=2306973 RepID=UPI001BDC8D20|nr:YhgE/Pip family protein [Bifidobacterium callimiconis]MBT1177554.1 YhgE/Pip family protein [Bifidobacterium callimiconis]